MQNYISFFGFLFLFLFVLKFNTFEWTINKIELIYLEGGWE